MNCKYEIIHPEEHKRRVIDSCLTNAMELLESVVPEEVLKMRG